MYFVISSICTVYILHVHRSVYIKTHGHVSATKKAVWHTYWCTSVLLTGTTNLPFSTSCISITTWPISIKFTHLCPPYTQPYILNIKKISPVFHKIYVPENCPIFFTFSFFTPFYTLLIHRFLSNLAHL